MTPAWVFWLIGIAWFSFVPNLYLLLRGMPHRLDRYPVATDLPKRFIVQITTVGSSPHVVDGIIEAIRRYSLPVRCEMWILTEEGDNHPYPADRIIRTPKNYVTPTRALRKTRALHYGRALRIREGLDLATTRILYLDDDSLPSEAYVRAAQRIDRDIAHGGVTIRRAERGNRVVYVADHYRTADCVATCPRYCGKGDVKVVHGEGMVATGEVEKVIGWDFGPGLKAEDLIFGRRASRSFRYGYIPEQLYISSPKSIRDLFKQRRRWYWATIESFWELDFGHRLFLMGRMANGYVGILAAFFMFYVPIAGIQLPPALFWSTLACLVGFFGFFAYGGWLNTRSRWEAAAAVVLAWPACFVEGGVLIGSLLFRRTSFDVVEKALPTSLVPPGGTRFASSKSPPSGQPIAPGVTQETRP